MSLSEKRPSLLYRFIKETVRLCYPKMQVIGTEHLPDEPVIVVGNHTQMNGPIACELYFPGKHDIWCAGQMMHLKEVPAYAFADFWAEKPRWCRWFYRLLSYLIAPLSVCVFNNADTIPVYHDSRVLTTFKTSVSRLQEGASMIIFPECPEPYNHIVCQFQDRFIDLARLYYKKTGTELAFVPLYIAPALKTMYIGTPTRFRADAPLEAERERICRYLMDEITAIAQSLPEHTVVPYRNVPKKQYPLNRPKETTPHEKTRR